MSLVNELEGALNERHLQHRYRFRHTVTSPQSVQLERGGKRYISFCSNDYLGLASHPEVVASLCSAAQRCGVGSGASHLVNGHSAEHHELELELADFTGRKRALLFSTGYMANMGVINALMRRGDCLYEDKLNHASLLDGGLLSSAELVRFNHNDMAHLEQRLQKNGHLDNRKLIVVDGVFSMDGDFANLPALSALAKRHKAWLMVDDAHGFGCVGEGGRGVVNYFDLGVEDVPILVGTLGKAFGTFGAFVAGSEALIETLIQFSRTYIYTTALPPAIAAATRTSLKLLAGADKRRQHLQALTTQFREGCNAIGLPLMPSSSPIQPIVIGDESNAVALSKALEVRGFWVTAIRPPTVPVGTSRLRITFSADHSCAQVDALLKALAELYPEYSSAGAPL
ncbi:MAG: 8-amino-7-oxononanoate synthase [Lentisphaeria bacterium]|jgi:8-amino-7-oxononanoate synthase